MTNKETNTAKNDVTGDTIITKPASEKYAEGYERIFMGNNKPKNNQSKESNRDHGGRTGGQ